MKNFSKLLITLLALTTFSCQSASLQPKTDAGAMRQDQVVSSAKPQSLNTTEVQTKLQPKAEALNPEVNFITQEEAKERASRVSQVHYQLQTDLTKSETNFNGQMNLEFQLSDITSDLKLDLTDAQISMLKVNGQLVSTPKQFKRHFMLPHEHLILGPNKVQIHYQALYSHSGEGLHRFVDPEDKRVYLYTQFEAFDANRFMPCFDQPDLKAKLQLSVVAPRTWIVISNTRENTMLPISKKNVKWDFPDTPSLSTYLFALHAGDFKVWRSQFGSIPLRLFARKSLSKYVVSEDWFRVTKQGLGFYQKYFAYDYPFYKYDQVIVPEFNAGAMENVAAVTFSERFVTRGKETRNQKAGTAEVILHELAHMWFGDLVTMKWWNDLWLNESFADFMENLATVSATEFKDAGMDVFSGGKQWAYRDDQLVTTHPIEANVKNTDESFTNFDGITYGKGSAVFKQLSYKMGDETFKKGVQSYFKKYAYLNTQREDFMKELGEASNQDLSNWSQSWLQDAGVDTLTYQVKCEAGKVSKLSLELENSIYSKKMRSHAFEIALFSPQEGKIKISKTIRISMDQRKMDVKEAVGAECPRLVYPNLGDYAYLRFHLDAVSVNNLKADFNKIEDPFMRLSFAVTLWQMVRDQKLKINEYADVALAAVTVEPNQKVLRQIVNSISGGRHSDENCIYFYLPNETEVEQKARSKFVAQIENIYAQLLRASPPDSDTQKNWLDALIHATETKEGLARLNALLEDKEKLAGLDFNQDRRWSTLQQMCKFNFPEVRAKLSSEEMRDSSSRAKESKLACVASIPNLENKKDWYAKVKSEKSEYSLGQIGQIARNIFPYQQRDLQSAFVDDFFEFITKSFDRDQEYLSTVSRDLIPALCNEQSAGRIRQFVGSNTQMPPVLVKAMRVAGQEDERCAKVHAFNKQLGRQGLKRDQAGVRLRFSFRNLNLKALPSFGWSSYSVSFNGSSIRSRVVPN